MNMNLLRSEFLSDGIFGFLESEDESLELFTLEHAYPVVISVDSLSTNWTPKVLAGTYTCVRHAPNRLPYETFMIENVPDFQGKPVTGILFHILNFNAESEGCIGVGLARTKNEILHSKDAFEKFMKLQEGCDKFTLTIS